MSLSYTKLTITDIFINVNFFNKIDLKKRLKMTRKCVYCGCELPSENVIDFCERCGISSFGSKMFKAIIENMEKAQNRGDLDQGTFS